MRGEWYRERISTHFQGSPPRSLLETTDSGGDSSEAFLGRKIHEIGRICEAPTHKENGSPVKLANSANFIANSANVINFPEEVFIGRIFAMFFSIYNFYVAVHQFVHMFRRPFLSTCSRHLWPAQALRLFDYEKLF